MEISKINLSGTSYDIKDTVARSEISKIDLSNFRKYDVTKDADGKITQLEASVLIDIADGEYYWNEDTVLTKGAQSQLGYYKSNVFNSRILNTTTSAKAETVVAKKSDSGDTFEGSFRLNNSLSMARTYVKNSTMNGEVTLKSTPSNQTSLLTHTKGNLTNLIYEYVDDSTAYIYVGKYKDTKKDVLVQIHPDKLGFLKGDNTRLVIDSENVHHPDKGEVIWKTDLTAYTDADIDALFEAPVTESYATPSSSGLMSATDKLRVDALPQFVSLTQLLYDLLTTKDSNTFYFIQNES